MTESPNFFKLCEIKVSLCSNKMTNPYDPLFRNTRENRVNTREDICCFSYSLFCAAFYKVWCGRAVIGVVFLVETSAVRISLLDIFFFVNFVLHVFKYHFCSPLLVSVFLILLIIFVKFTYSINRKLYFVSCFVQLTKLCVIKYFRACRPLYIRIFPVISPKTTFRILKNSEAGHENLNIKLTKYVHSHVQIKLYLSFIRTIYLHRNVKVFPRKITIVLKKYF